MKLLAGFTGTPIVLANLVVIFALTTLGCSGSSASNTSKRLNLKFMPGKFDLTIINDGSPDAAGKTFDVFVNGNPPAGFKGSFIMPAIGQNVTVHLDELADDNGVRFNPAQKMTALWIGGSGYAMNNFAR
jgi:hypothetical protein